MRNRDAKYPHTVLGDQKRPFNAAFSGFQMLRDTFAPTQPETITMTEQQEDLVRELQCIKRDGSWAASVRLRDQHPVCRRAAQALATARAEAEALRSLLAEVVPPKLIGESHDPYPEGKTTILMDWDWLKRTRAALSKGPTQ